MTNKPVYKGRNYAMHLTKKGKDFLNSKTDTALKQDKCREAFESRRIPNLDLTLRKDGGYLYEVAQMAYRDFADGWQAAWNTRAI